MSANEYVVIDGVRYAAIANVGGVELTNLSNTLGLYTPGRDVLMDWFHGSDTAYDTIPDGTTVAGRWVDMSEVNADMRSIVIINEDGTAIDFDYVINFSRNGQDDDAYQVAVNTANTATPLQVNLPASLGYDQYVQCTIRPETGQAGTQENFKVYLAGRGG